MTPEDIAAWLPDDEELVDDECARWNDIISEALVEHEGLANVVFVRREADWYLHGFYWLEPRGTVHLPRPGRVAPVSQRTVGVAWAPANGASRTH